jgi:hypothetical protein
MLKNLLLFIIIVFLFIVFYFNKTEYFEIGAGKEIEIASYQSNLDKLKSMSEKLNESASSLDSSKRISSLEEGNIKLMKDNIDNIKTNLKLPEIKNLFTDISTNINTLYSYSILKDPTSQNIL